MIILDCKSPFEVLGDNKKQNYSLHEAFDLKIASLCKISPAPYDLLSFKKK